VELSWLMAVDGTGLFVRSAKAARYIGLTAPDGTPTGALTLFANSLAAMVREVRPQFLVIAWDGGNGTAWRRKIVPEYKQNRAALGYYPPRDIREFDAVREFCNAARVAQWCMDDFEGDDMLAAAARLAVRDLPGTRVMICSDDKDALQLARADRVWVRNLGKNGLLADAETVEAMHYGTVPEDIPKLRALAGDKSDGIPGVRGIGLLRAAVILGEASHKWPLPAMSVPDPADYSRVLAWHDIMDLNDPPETPEDHDETGILDIRKTEWDRGNVLPVLQKYAMSAMGERWSKGTFW
jgi:DNA polymerase I